MIAVYFWVFLGSLAGGLLTVFTPYLHSFVPMTLSTLVFQSKNKEEGAKNTIIFSAFIVLIFTSVGLFISTIFKSTGLFKLTGHWLFNLFLCRFLAGLGLSMIGAFELSLPMKIIRATHNRAKRVDVKGLFFMALSLPVVTFASTFPFAGLIMVLAGNYGVWGPAIAMLGFSIGLASPFFYPRIINLVPSTALSYVKVTIGFILFFIGVKLFSNADIAKGWHILDRGTFLFVWIVLCCILGSYLLGWFKLNNDFMAQLNVYGVQYVSLFRLFMAIAVFTLAIYLLPGLFGAPLKGVAGILPNFVNQ